MQSFIHADIFFFTTTVVIIVFGILFAIILFYITKILVDIREISRIARNESNDIAEDIKLIRKEVGNFSLIKVIRNLFRFKKSNSRSKTKKINEKNNKEEV